MVFRFLCGRGFPVAALGMILFLALGVSGSFAADQGHEGQKHVVASAEHPEWLNKLEGQVDREENESGLNGSRQRLDKTFMKLMGKVKQELKEHAAPASSGGMYHDSWSAHQMGQSFLLGPTEASAKIYKGAHCASSAPVKQYDISAINVEITLNQWGDYYPGYMYVLTRNVEGVRAEEEKNAAAREDELDPGAVKNGLQGDLIQPLVIRGNQGDCVRFKVRNAVEDEDIAFQVNGSEIIISSTGQPATAATPGAVIPAGESQDFEWQIPIDEQEGGRMIQSHAGRDPSSLGLIGTFNVEPRGSTYLSPFTGEPLDSGWEMIIAQPNNRDFREFVLMYHEVGDESFRPLNRHGEMFVYDADMEYDIASPWYRPTRINHGVSGGENGWRATTKKMA